MRKKLLLTMLLVSALFSMSLVGIGVVSANDVMYKVDPYLVELEGASPGQTFTVNIVVEEVRRLWGYQIELLFDPTVIIGVSAENGPFLESAGGTAIWAPGAGPDNEAGRWMFGAALYPKARFPSGDGILARATFAVAGTGETAIAIGENSGLADSYGRWILQGPGIPGHVTIADVAPPELYIRTRGCEGVTGIWEEWQVGYPGQEQILYTRIMNYGTGGATIKVKFVVMSAYGTQEIMSSEAEIGPCVLEGNKWIPDSAELNTGTFTPPGPGPYHNMGHIYYKLGTLYYYDGAEEFYPLYEGEEGVGSSRPTNTAWKVQTD